MSDFSSSDQDRERSERPRSDRSGSERAPYRRPERSSNDRPTRSGEGRSERKPYERRDGKPGERSERKPYERGERKPYERRDGKPGERSERKPWEKRDSSSGERKPYERRDGKPGERSERKPWEKRDAKPGERKPYERGERKPYERRDGKPGERSERKPWETRDGKAGERKPYERRDSTPGGRKPYERRDGDDRPKRDFSDRPRRDFDDRPRRDFDDDRPRHNDPIIPDSVQARDLDKGAYIELKGLSKENAERVARHLVASALAFEADPELAHRHALAAARTAGRIAVVRETVAITAYETGDFALALRELRTYRRLTGKNDHIALIVDSERGLERPEKAIEEGRAVDRASIPVESRVALAIAMSGARLDLGQAELALGELEIPELDANRAFSYSPALFHAYAEVLDELGRAKDSASWRHRAEVAQSALDEEFSGDDIIEVFEELDEAIADVVEADTPQSPSAGDPDVSRFPSGGEAEVEGPTE